MSVPAKTRKRAAELAEQLAALEAQIVTLRNLECNHRSQMRDHLTHQLALLEGDVPELPTAVAG